MQRQNHSKGNIFLLSRQRKKKNLTCLFLNDYNLFLVCKANTESKKQ